MTKEEFLKLLNKGIITQTGFIDPEGDVVYGGKKFDGDLDEIANRTIMQSGITDGTLEGKKTSEWISKNIPAEDKDGDGQPDAKKLPVLEMTNITEPLPYDGTTGELIITANDYAGANVSLNVLGTGCTANTGKTKWSSKSLKDTKVSVSIMPDDVSENVSILLSLVDDQDNVLSTLNSQFAVAKRPTATERLQAKLDAGGAVTLDDDVDLETELHVTKKTTLNLNGHILSNTKAIWDDKHELADDQSWSLISVRKGGDLTISGEGSLVAKKDDCYTLDVRGGKLTVNDGTFNGNIHTVYVYEGEAHVKGGSYDIQQLYPTAGQEYGFVINCYDANHKAGTAKVDVSGGRFHKFDPSNNFSEGEGTNILKKGYKSEADGEYFVVSKA